MARRDAEGYVIRPPRADRDFDADFSTVEGLVRYGLFYLNRAGNTAGMCMADRVGDERAVRDLHDIIGDLSAVLGALQLLEKRAVMRDTPTHTDA